MLFTIFDIGLIYLLLLSHTNRIQQVEDYVRGRAPPPKIGQKYDFLA
jgi:hypothetical protein